MISTNVKYLIYSQNISLNIGKVIFQKIAQNEKKIGINKI